MATATDIKKTLTDATPLYAVVGAGDLAVEKIREVPERLSGMKIERPRFELPKVDLPKFEAPKFERPRIDIPTDPQAIRTRVSNTATVVQEKVGATFSTLTTAGKDAPAKAQDFAKTQYGKARGQVETQVGKAGDYADKLREFYEELADRGHKVVDRMTKKEPEAGKRAAEPKTAAAPKTAPKAEAKPEPKTAAKKQPAAKRAPKKAAPSGD